MNSARRIAMLIVASLALVVSVGCSGPRSVRRATHSNDTIKFAYMQQTLLGSETGVIQCRAAADGSLSQCKRLKIHYPDGN